MHSPTHSFPAVSHSLGIALSAFSMALFCRYHEKMEKNRNPFGGYRPPIFGRGTGVPRPTRAMPLYEALRLK